MQGVKKEEAKEARNDIWPKTNRRKLVDRIILTLSEEDKANIRKMKKKDLISLDFGLGEYIRNEFGLWQGKSELLESCFPGGYPPDPDEISGVIIRSRLEKPEKDLA